MVTALFGGNGFELRGTVGPVVDGTLVNLVSHLAVALIVHDGTDRPVNRQLLPVDTEARDLSIEVGEVPALKERVVAEADAGNNVRSTEGDLLDLGEVFINGAVKNHLSDDLEGNKLLRPDLGRVEDIEVEVMLARLRDDLDAEVPLGIGTGVNRLREVLAVEV